MSVPVLGRRQPRRRSSSAPPPFSSCREPSGRRVVMSEIALAVLQVLGVVLTGIFGLLGLLTKYRNDVGRITKWGRIALVGIVVSTLVAVSSQALEAVRKARESRAAAERTERIISEVARAVHPLTSIEATAWALMPWDHPQLASYRKRIEPQLRRIATEWRGNIFEQPLICRTLSCLVGQRPPLSQRDAMSALVSTPTISFDRKSSLFPSKSETRVRLLTESRLHVAIYKNRIDPATFAVRSSSSSQPPPDLAFSVDYDSSDSRGPELTYEIKNQALVLYTSGRVTPRFGYSGGSIVAIPDLLNAQMLVALAPGSLSQDEATGMLKPSSGRWPRLADERYGLELRSVLVHFGGRSILVAPNRGATSHISADGFPLWSYEFPPTLDELGSRKLQKSTPKAVGGPGAAQ
jgi:hypothetical protein